MRSSVSRFQDHVAPDVESKDESWFLSQLQSNCQEVQSTNSDFLIVCPFHADSNPSCHVDKHNGMYHCFSCSAGGHWNKLAAKIGAEELKREVNTSTLAELKDQMSRSLTKAGITGGKKTIGSSGKKGKRSRPIVRPWSKNDSWRSVSGRFLVDVGCVKVLDVTHSVTRIGLPIRNMDDHLLGYTCRAIDPEDVDPKYMPLSAIENTWRKTELPVRESLFLLDMAIDQDWPRLVLTEGPYDALHLVGQGVPAVAILGTSSWTPEKVAMISGLGLEAVLVVMDNDRSGKKAQREIVSSLKGRVRVKTVGLPSSVKDPGDLSHKQIQWLRKVLYQA